MLEQRPETELMLAVPLQERGSSVSSLRPVGISVRANDPNRTTYETLSNEWDISERRRRLARVVVGAVAACGVILAAAGIRVVAGLVPSSLAAGAPSTVAVRAPAEPTPTPAALPERAAGTPAEPRAAADPANGAPPKSAAPTMGAVILEHPAAPGHVWFDGERLTGESSTVACGRHEIRVGLHGRPHPIDVPCGGDVHIAR